MWIKQVASPGNQVPSARMLLFRGRWAPFEGLPCHPQLSRGCPGFFHDAVSQMQLQEDTEQKLKKTKVIILMGPRDGRHAMPPHAGPLRGSTRGRFRPGPLLGFPWDRRAGRGKQFKSASLNSFGGL